MRPPLLPKELSVIEYPVIAAPNAMPSIADSEIAVSKTRASPNASYRPLVAPNGPPGLATSSPKMIVSSRDSIAQRNAAWTPWMYRRSGIDVLQEGGRVRHGNGPR